MNNCNQLLEQAESLKKELSNGRNGLSSDGSGKGEWVSSRTTLQDVYRQLLITNLEYALDKKIEQELWNFVFKNHITALQQQIKDKSNTFRTEAQSQLTSFLDAASGFYTQLLDDLCQTFQVNIPYRVHSSKLVFLKDAACSKRSAIAQAERPSCQYMCQHCLVHLGDIARYRNQIGQAESYYRYAAQLVPSNGQPYNQLAILAAAGGDVLSTAFYYCRSLAVKCPFPGSDTNLRRQLSKIMAGDEPRHTKISTSELVKFCLKFHACIYLKKNQSELNGMVERLSGFIRAHLRAGSLSRQQITHMTFLNLFSLYHLAPNGVNVDGGPADSTGDGAEEQSDAPRNEKLTSEHVEHENVSWSAMLTFTMHMLGGLLACVPAHSDDASDLEHPALPSIKLTLDWLASNTPALQRLEVAQNSRVWPRLAKVLNALGNQDNANNMDNHHLPEDLEVRGFVGLKTPLSKLEFLGGIESGVPSNMEHSCRCYRLYQLGITISQVNGDLLSCIEENTGTVFQSSILPSPQHGTKVNGVEERSEEENDGVDEEEEEQEELSLSPPKSSIQKYKEVQLVEAPSSGASRRVRTKGVLKVLTDDHSSSMRKKNRAPRMQNVAVQIKPDHKLKVIKEEDNDNFTALGESESGGTSTESSQGDTSPSAGAHSRSGHRVTFATAQQVSPTHYPQDDTPSPVATGYMEQGNMMIPGVPMYADANSHLVQQQFMPNLHLASQQMGPIYRQPPAGSPILTSPYARRGMGPYTFSHNMIARPHIQIPPSFQHIHPSNPPPHPAELPKPVFQGSMYNPNVSSENYRASSGSNAAQMALSTPSADVNLEQVMKMSRPNDIGYFQHMHQSTIQNLSNLSPTSQDLSPTQRPGGPTMAAHFANRPSMNMSVMQHLRMQEMVRSAEIASESSKDLHLDSSGLPFHSQNLLQQSNQQKQALDFSQFANSQQAQQKQLLLRSQTSGLPNAGNALPQRQLQSIDNELSRMSADLARGVFPNNFMVPAANTTAGGSNNTSSTSSPTPGSLNNQLGNLPNATCSPQAGSMHNHNYAGVGNVLGPGLSSMLMDHSSRGGELDMPRRPSTLAGPPLQHGGVGFVGSPNQKLTPTGLGPFLNSDHSQSEKAFNRDIGSSASMFGISPNPTSCLSDDLRPLVQPVNQSPSTDPYPSYSIQQDRVKAIFEDATRKAIPKVSSNPMDVLQSSQSVQQIDKFRDPVMSKEDKDSYRLFPVTDSAWGISRGNKGEGLGLSGLGTIGSERAAAQHNQRYSPWGGPPQAPTPDNSNIPDKLNIQRAREMNQSTPDGNFAALQSQSFWSTPMMPSGPSALEQLIRQQQQQHVTRDKSPP